MLKFTILNGKVVIDPTLLMIQEFTDIMDYAGKNEDLGNRLLLYIFYCCDLTNQNPMRDVDFRLKEEQAMSRALKAIKKTKFTKKEEALISSAMDAYNFFNETALERAGLTYDQKIDEIRSLLEHTKPELHAVYETATCNTCEENPTDIIEKYVSNDKIIGNFAKQLNELAIYKLKAMETAKKIENTGRVRGDKGSSLIERGVFREESK